MSTKIYQKKYCRLVFKLVSSLSIGSGINDSSDHDILKDGAGKPFIPATSITGTLRNYFKGKDCVDDYFGIDEEDNPLGSNGSSSLIFYDGTLLSEEYYITTRDSISLDEFKNIKKGAKFDMEVLEPGVCFVTYVEQSFTSPAEEDYIPLIENAFASGKLCFGYRTTRGYGRIRLLEAGERVFYFNDVFGKNNLEQWLAFDLETGSWDEVKLAREEKKRELKINLELISGITIKRYTTQVSDETELTPDCEQLTVTINKDSIPVIPGNSWAGAFKQRMGEFGIDVYGKNSIFGYVDFQNTKNKKKSSITFSESLIMDSRPLVASRNSIDRFSGGTSTSILFTEKSYHGGTTQLNIGWREASPMPEEEMKVLAAAITDLHLGYMAIGGGTALGRGRFRVTEIGGKDISSYRDEEVYDVISEAVHEVFGDRNEEVEEND